MGLKTRKYYAAEKLIHRIGGYRMVYSVHHHVYSCLALAHAEGALQLYFVIQTMLCNQLLQAVHDLM